MPTQMNENYSIYASRQENQIRHELDNEVMDDSLDERKATTQSIVLDPAYRTPATLK